MLALTLVALTGAGCDDPTPPFRRLTHSVSAYASWSPDGKRIAFCSGPSDANQCVYLMKRDGTGRVQLTAPAPGSDFCYDVQPAFSRDGRWLAFTRYRPFGEYESSELYLYDLSKVKD